MRWKAAAKKKFIAGAGSRILALDFLCGTGMDRPSDTVRDVEENRRGISG